MSEENKQTESYPPRCYECGDPLPTVGICSCMDPRDEPYNPYDEDYDDYSDCQDEDDFNDWLDDQEDSR